MSVFHDNCNLHFSVSSGTCEEQQLCFSTSLPTGCDCQDRAITIIILLTDAAAAAAAAAGDSAAAASAAGGTAAAAATVIVPVLLFASLKASLLIFLTTPR